jgi:hypothetical protein
MSNALGLLVVRGWNVACEQAASCSANTRHECNEGAGKWRLGAVIRVPEVAPTPCRQPTPLQCPKSTNTTMQGANAAGATECMCSRRQCHTSRSYDVLLPVRYCLGHNKPLALVSCAMLPHHPSKQARMPDEGRRRADVLAPHVWPSAKAVLCLVSARWREKAIGRLYERAHEVGHGCSLVRKHDQITSASCSRTLRRNMHNARHLFSQTFNQKAGARAVRGSRNSSMIHMRASTAAV